MKNLLENRIKMNNLRRKLQEFIFENSDKYKLSFTTEKKLDGFTYLDIKDIRNNRFVYNNRAKIIDVDNIIEKAYETLMEYHKLNS